MAIIPENRPLTAAESNFIRWSLENGDERARSFLLQVDDAQVIGRCGCGCASIDFGINDAKFCGPANMEILCDYCWHDANGAFFGVFAFARDELLAGIDLWSIDGQSTATELPNVSSLTPLSQQN